MTEFVKSMGDECDFLHPRLNSSTVLQCIQGVTSQLCSTLYDGLSEQELHILILECSKLCVSSQWF